METELQYWTLVSLILTRPCLVGVLTVTFVDLLGVLADLSWSRRTGLFSA